MFTISKLLNSKKNNTHSETRNGIHDWDFNALSKQMRDKGVYIPTESGGRSKNSAFVLLIGGKPSTIVTGGCCLYHEAEQTAIGILYGARLYKKSAGVCVYVWGSDNCWHLAYELETHYAFTPSIVNNPELFDEKTKEWNIDFKTMPDYK